MNETTVTKTSVNGKHVYTFKGYKMRTSKREYRFALLGTYEQGRYFFIGLGNNAQTLKNSWKHIYIDANMQVVEIINV